MAKQNSQQILFKGMGAGSALDLGTLSALYLVQVPDIAVPKSKPAMSETRQVKIAKRTIQACQVAKAKATAMKLLNIVAVDMQSNRAIYHDGRDTMWMERLN